MNNDAAFPAGQPGASQWIGKPLRRLEDARLLTGQGRFTDDVRPEGAAHVAFLRSPHAHARFAAPDVAAARAAPGVLAVYTGADVAADGVGPIPFTHLHKRQDGSPIVAPPRMPITADEARFVGDAVAMVVAETREQARDAAELIEVAWEPMDAIAGLEAAGRAGHVAAYYHAGDRAAREAAFAAAKHVVRLQVVNQRVVANPIEPRSLAAHYDVETGRYTLWCPTQNVHTVRAQLATSLGDREEALRIVSTDVGGGFGARGYAYPEHAALLWAAKKLGRPLRWLADRSENFLAEVHGRDNLTVAEIAIDAENRFTALRIRTLANIGAYISSFGAAVPAMSGVRAPTGVYAIPVLDHEVKMMFTNTTPVDAYRGAGRPEMGYLLERLVARAARELGVDPIELRLKNLIPAARMPYANPAGYTYDCGDFERILRGALEAADWEGFAARKRAAEKRGLRYGRGLACYVEITGSARLSETVRMIAAADGTLEVDSGTQSIGQGLWTSYAQVVAEKLGIDPQKIRVVQGDSDLLKVGGGAGGSRGLQVGGSAALAGAVALIEAARPLAAQALEAAAADLEYGDGGFRIAGTDRGIGLFELAAQQPERRIVCEHTETAKGQTWPNGCQIVEVEVDPQTGAVQVVRHGAVDDIGRVINPLTAESQIHGGVAQGLGQALFEQSVYDEHGQLLTGSFMDYAMPRATDMPDMKTRFDQSVPTQQNLLGAKGAGEAGCHGAVPAIVNAVIDALGVKELDMPLTPERVWRALHAGQAGT
ncbi:MAG: xanthine dehydrogenase family protein molybdopterin-binding subunit [Betaproteobacteria bacterium]|nr:xanthine dehydrogenase family protein molybdopterin-binding subunit [Betaproteobacteria bacterium]